MMLAKQNWLWLILTPLLLVALVACDDDDGNLNDFEDTDDQDGQIGTTVAGSPTVTIGTPDTDRDSTPDRDGGGPPSADQLPGIIEDGLDDMFGDAEWVNDVGDIERDGNTVKFKLDRNFDEDRTAFQDACNAVTDLVMDSGVLDVDTVEVEDEDGDVVMAADGTSECEAVAG